MHPRYEPDDRWTGFNTTVGPRATVTIDAVRDHACRANNHVCRRAHLRNPSLPIPPATKIYGCSRMEERRWPSPVSARVEARGEYPFRRCATPMARKRTAPGSIEHLSTLLRQPSYLGWRELQFDVTLAFQTVIHTPPDRDRTGKRFPVPPPSISIRATESRDYCPQQ
jgi:hypothetical protein